MLVASGLTSVLVHRCLSLRGAVVTQFVTQRTDHASAVADRVLWVMRELGTVPSVPHRAAAPPMTWDEPLSRSSPSHRLRADSRWCYYRCHYRPALSRPVGAG
jgi:hypothetical protein